MKARLVLGLLVSVLACGCAGGIDVESMVQDFDRYDEDLQAVAEDRTVNRALESGRQKRADAGALVEGGKKQEAVRAAEQALADARLAQEMQKMDAAARRAEQCRLEVERSRTAWREALFVLEQTEEFLGQEAAVSRRAPEPAQEETALPASTLAPDELPSPTFSEVLSHWTVWRQAAGERRVSAADLENDFLRSRAEVEADKVTDVAVAHHTYLAARAVQSLECRVRSAADERACLEAVQLAARFDDARAEALRATLDLERGLQDDLRGELAQLRAEARTRQDELFDALSQMEGKFARIRRDARGTIVSLADILFDFDKATLRRNVEFNLVKIAAILNQFEEMNILIEGHTDSIGTEEYNLDLSRRRAEAVHEFLVSQDVDPSRMSWEGYGESRPVADNNTEEGRQRNRRVDLVIQDAP
ncbi:MAG: OmpA family protein [Candidatus Eisenbacteria bacterium]|nr:OmpA family protein [Candidatus Eisenbacteria bacterium]